MIAVKSGFVRRAAVVACVAFAGCTVEARHRCAEYPGIYGPCSWVRSVWHAAELFTFSAVSTAALMAVALWVAGVPIFGGKR